MTLQKCIGGMIWPELVMGDQRGEYIISDEQAALIHEKLSDLTSEDLVQVFYTFNMQISNYYYHRLWSVVVATIMQTFMFAG